MPELYNQRSALVQKQNEHYLELFEQSMQGKLSDKVIRRHLSNMDMYLNWFLVDYVEHDWGKDETDEDSYGPAPMEDGMHEIGEFLGYIYIRKCLNSTPATIKSTAASIKKFYKCMLENQQYGELSEEEFKEEYDDMLERIKDGLDDWMADRAQYNDPDQLSPFAFF